MSHHPLRQWLKSTPLSLLSPAELLRRPLLINKTNWLACTWTGRDRNNIRERRDVRAFVTGRVNSQRCRGPEIGRCLYFTFSICPSVNKHNSYKMEKGCRQEKNDQSVPRNLHARCDVICSKIAVANFNLVYANALYVMVILYENTVN